MLFFEGIAVVISGGDLAIGHGNYKVGEICYRVYWNLAEDGWRTQKVVIQAIKHIDGKVRFRVGKDVWTDAASLFKNYRTALGNKAFREEHSHSIREVDFKSAALAGIDTANSSYM